MWATTKVRNSSWKEVKMECPVFVYKHFMCWWNASAWKLCCNKMKMKKLFSLVPRILNAFICVYGTETRTMRKWMKCFWMIKCGGCKGWTHVAEIWGYVENFCGYIAQFWNYFEFFEVIFLNFKVKFLYL